MFAYTAPEPVSPPQQRAFALYTSGGGVTWTRADAATQLDTYTFRTREAGLIPAPVTGLFGRTIVAFRSGDGIYVDLDPGVIPVVRHRHGIENAQLADDTYNDRLAVAWSEAGRRVYAANREPGRPFGAPVLLGRGRIRNLTVSQSTGGSTIVAWQDGTTIRVRLRRGSTWGPRLTIRALPARTTALLASLHKGSATVAWTSRGGYVQAAVGARGHHTFSPALQLQRAPDGGGLALTGRLIAWGGPDGVHVDRLDDSGVADGYSEGAPGSSVTDVNTRARVAYTRRGEQYVALGPGGEVPVGPGGGGRFEGDTLYWIDDGVVERAYP